MALVISRYCRIQPDTLNSGDILIKTAEATEIQLNDFNHLYKQAGLEYPKYFKMDAPSKFGVLAADYLFKDYNWKKDYQDHEIGIVLANASGSLDTDREFQKTIENGDNFFPSPAIFVYTLSNIVMGEICIKYKIKGENMFFLSEGIQSELLTTYVATLLNSNPLKSLIVGWMECTNGKPDILLMYVEHSSKTSGGIEFNKEQIELLYGYNESINY
jgi:hypothetical protein